jgi:hypothetical protein
MLYFGGGYPGLYFPLWLTATPSPELASLVVPIPMHIVTGGLTHVVRIPTGIKRAMTLLRSLTVPMRIGSARVDVPMHLSSDATLPAHVTSIALEVPVAVVTGGTTAPVAMTTTLTHAMPVTREVTVPMGLGSPVIPMALSTDVTLGG